MNNYAPHRWAAWLSLQLAALVAAASLGGLLLPSAYTAETRLHAAQMMGIDAGDLVVIAPVLVAAAVLARRGSIAAHLVWMGVLAYLAYNFAGYAFGVHFNQMFLAYCGVLGLSSYALAGSLAALPLDEIAQRYGPRAPARITATVLLLMAGGTLAHWLAEAVPALLSGQAPQAIRDSGSLTEPVAVLDLSFMAPACIVTAILLLRRKPLGFVLGPVALAFLGLSSLVLLPMGLAVDRHGFKAGYALYAIALGLAAACAVLLALWFRKSKAAHNGLQ